MRATDGLLVANMLILIGLGVSAPAWFFILALYIYTSGVGLLDSLTSYAISALSAEENVAELYV